MKNAVKLIQRIPFLVLCMLFYSLTITAQNRVLIKGTVLDENNDPIIGANIMLKGNNSIGTIADIDGNFQLTVPSESSVIVVSFIGMLSKEIKVGNNKSIRVVLQADNVVLEEVIVVGYGQQKKASVVGAITQTSGQVLERAGGVTNVGAALTGNLPGVITYASTGMPGAEDPQIIIRSQSSWNNSNPLVLVDGIERSMSTVDIATVETISVLKDASATAVYGVKGANGVILITTKRGKEGKANIQIKANMTAKVASQLPQKYDAYDTFLLRNRAIERELPLMESAWASYKPMDIINKYRNPLNAEEWDRYANVDWEKELFRDFAMSYNSSVNVSGGSKFVSYFTSVDFLHEGDLFKTFENNRGYNSGYGYNRINVRSNLDFNLTKTTKFSANLFGSNGVRTVPWAAGDSDSQYWSSAYRTAPDAMRPIYSNGMWGWYAPRNADVPNSVYNLAVSGTEEKTTTKINTDFALSQKLDMITKGLSFKGTFSFDNTFVETGRGVNDLYHDSQRMWVDPETGNVTLQQQVNTGTQLDYADGISWTTAGGAVATGSTYRKMYYQLQLNYTRQFGKHEVTAMGLFSRDKSATGSSFPSYREDWVYRLTYNYGLRYFAEINGAYNGSEKFGPGYRFDYFPSYSLGWMVSEESFMKKLNIFDMLKLRASYGNIGDDFGNGNRHLYSDQWEYGGNTQMGDIPANTPYTFYRQTRIGNPDLRWEKVEKRNFGVDYSFLKGFIAGSVDVFKDKRTDIILGSRTVPSYFGASAPAANMGEATSKGYELELRLNYRFANDMRVWLNSNMTHATNIIKFRDDPELTPFYQKNKGYAIGKTLAYIDTGFLTTWDDIYGSTERTTNNGNKLVGDYNIIDFNGDGTIDSDDRAPYGYSGTPQNTYNCSLGFEWKGFSAFVQFYGVSNVTREVTFPTFHSSSSVAYVEGTYYSLNGDGTIPLPRWTTSVGGDAAGTRYLFDGSYARLKNAEIAYTFSGNWIKKLGLKTCRLYLNGTNLLLWTDMPDDRESNFSGSSSFGAYPTVRRFNLGIDITL